MPERSRPDLKVVQLHSMCLLCYLQGEECAHSGKDGRHSGGGRALAAVDVKELAVFVEDVLGEHIIHR